MKNYERRNELNESGAALVTVLMISVLLGIACIALLSSVGANSKNSTDVLSESKAYYAAESGLQATINVLRNDDSVTYADAVSNPTLAGKIPYNYPTTGTATRLVLGISPTAYNGRNGEAYNVYVTDPDSSASSMTFSTAGKFVSYSVASGAEISVDEKTIYIPTKIASPRTEIAFTDAGSTTHNFTSNPSLGTFTLTNVGGGVQITGEIQFEIAHRVTLPRVASPVIYGSIKKDPTDLKVNFRSQRYQMLGSQVELCVDAVVNPPCADVSLNLTTTPTSVLFANITPMQAYRLKVVATGYGPNGATKKLEGVIQKNFFNGLASGAATTMIGPSTPPFQFAPGTSNGITYNGGDCTSATGCVPSFGLTNPANLAYVKAHPPGGDPTHMTPPPALLDQNNIPEWQQNPANLDILISQLRTAAINSGRRFINPTGNDPNFTVGSNTNPPGDFTNGTGITFCEGSCKMGASGGGILVVTGKLTNIGGFDFKGMIIVTGEEGWQRNGAGNGQVIGNVVIAPYNRISYYPQNLSTAFLPPQYVVTGGGTSDVIYDNIAATFDNTSSISDFMLGIAEK